MDGEFQRNMYKSRQPFGVSAFIWINKNLSVVIARINIQLDNLDASLVVALYGTLPQSTEKYN